MSTSLQQVNPATTNITNTSSSTQQQTQNNNTSSHASL